MKTSTMALVVLFTLLAGGSPFAGGPGSGPVTPSPTASDALRHAAQSMAEDLGIAVEDAIRRLQYQNEIGELRATLVAQEADTFGGLWVEHEPKYAIVVAFTRNGRRTIRPHIGDKPWADLVEVRSARATLSELESALHQTLSATHSLGYPLIVALNEMENQVEVTVSDREWFEEELRQAGIELPEHVELVVVPGPSPREIDICGPSPVEGVAFPRQQPVPRPTMAALLIGTLVLDDGCLRVESLYGDGSYLPVWPPEFEIAAEGDQIHIFDGIGEVVARVGEEVYMGGGTGTLESIPQCVRQRLPAACGEPIWIVGEGVRPNLRQDSDLFSLDVISSTERSFLLLRKKPVLDEWAERGSTATGTLVLWEGQRCPRVVSGSPGGNYLALWPADYEARSEGDVIELVAGTGEVVARVGEEVALGGGPIPGGWESEQYRQLHGELPGDCYGPYWIVED